MVKLTGGILKQYYDLARDVVIPYQWEALNDRIAEADKSHCISNIEIAAGIKSGDFGGFIFQDSDFSKWIEAVGYFLQNGECKEWEEISCNVLDLIEKAQEPSGYFNTFFQLVEPNRKWTNIWECHELYCVGHLIEGLVSFYEATKNDKALKIATKLANCVDDVFGYGKLEAAPGHQEVELALVKLYELTGEKKYLDLGKFFIDVRGTEPNFFNEEVEKHGDWSCWHKGKRSKPDLPYAQAHLPVREQKVAIGHAVRMAYMCAGMADTARLTNDESLINACETLWDNITNKQMYVTGGIGQTPHGEAFTYDYNLPNDTNYSETCASIALIFFAHRMQKIKMHGKYGDIMENAFYNTVLAGIHTDGRHYFYVNPMEVDPIASVKEKNKHHIKPVRQKWYGCACCPPNVARLLASIGEYMVTCSSDEIYIHLFGSMEFCGEMNGVKYKLELDTKYPSDGSINITFSPEKPVSGVIALRLPSWHDGYNIYIDSKNADNMETNIKDGYIYISGEFSENTIIKYDLELKPKRVYAHANVRHDAGKVCLQRGAIIYCLEECKNGAGLHSLSVSENSEITEVVDNENGIINLCADGIRDCQNDNDDALYSFKQKKRVKTQLTFTPYYLWGNGENPGEMTVWVRELPI